MRKEKFTLSYALYFSLIFFAVIVFLPHTIPAQSGRVKPIPTPMPEQTETKTGSPETKQNERVSALKVTGEIQYETGWSKSNYLSVALKECVNTLKARPQRAIEVAKTDKMKLNDAKELAKKEYEAT